MQGTKEEDQHKGGGGDDDDKAQDVASRDTAVHHVCDYATSATHSINMFKILGKMEQQEAANPRGFRRTRVADMKQEKTVQALISCIRAEDDNDDAMQKVCCCALAEMLLDIDSKEKAAVIQQAGGIDAVISVMAARIHDAVFYPVHLWLVQSTVVPWCSRTASFVVTY